jgi:DNA topoisomerase-3
MHRNGRELVPTPKAFSLFFALRHFGVTEITSPELTGDWEFKLKQMEHGKLKREEFMEHIEQVTRDLVERIKHGDIPDTAFATVPAPCPRCGGTVQGNYRKFQCQKCDFSLWKVTSGREWSPEEVATLITKRSVGPLTGFRSRMGKPFSAALKLNDELRPEFDFGQGSAAGDGEPAPDFSAQESVGACPKCGARVFDHGVAYVCEKSVGAERSCDFRTGKIILQQPVEREQMRKLLATGRTDLLARFISKKGRPFKAFLVKTPGGKIGFEFQARARKPGAKPQAEAPLAEVKPLVKKPAPKAPAKATRRGSARRARSPR